MYVGDISNRDFLLFVKFGSEVTAFQKGDFNNAEKLSYKSWTCFMVRHNASLPFATFLLIF